MNYGFYGMPDPERERWEEVLRVQNPESLPDATWSLEGALAFHYNAAQFYRCTGEAWEQVAAPYNN